MPLITDESAPLKTKRKGGEKSKTGCLTCRIRRVKCDENRPLCQRCTSTGRRCEGPVPYEYNFVREDLAQPTSPSYTLPSPMQSALGTSHFQGSQRHSFDFFLQRAAPALSGALDPYFWEHIVPQLSQSEPVVRNAVLAISSLYEHPHMSMPPFEKAENRPVTDPHHRQALDWYNAAISCFNGHVQQASRSTSVALISCILFICIELQQDGFANALTLLEKGLALHASTVAAAGATYEGMSTVDETITRFFSRLATLASVFGREPPSSWFASEINRQAVETGLSSFQTLHEARCLLYTLIDQSHAFLRDADKHVAQALQADSDLIARQQTLLFKLGEWYAAFKMIESVTPETIVASSRLSMLYDSIYIWVATHLNPSQTAFDQHCSRFERIVHRADIALDLGRTDIPFTFDIGLILPLHFAACKCRQPLLRRRALYLLKKCPAKECLWKALPHAWIAEKAIELEEQVNGRLMEFTGAYGSETEGEALIFESKRAYRLEVVDESKTGCTLTFVTKPDRYLVTKL